MKIDLTAPFVATATTQTLLSLSVGNCQRSFRGPFTPATKPQLQMSSQRLLTATAESMLHDNALEREKEKIN